MADHQPNGDGKQHHLWEGVPLLHGPLTQEEHRIADEKAAIQAEKEAEAAFRLRQLALTASANRLTRTYIILTSVLAFFSALGTGAAWYQGYVANKNAGSAEIAAKAAKSAADTANDTLNEMKTGQGAQDTHKLAGQAVTQALQTTKLAGATTSVAQTSKDALVSVQRAFVFPSPGYVAVYKPNTTELSSIEIQPIWGNAGITPTKNMVIHGSEEYRSAELPDDFTFPDMWDAGVNRVATPFFLGPKGSSGAHSKSVPLVVVESITDQKVYLYLWGWARYNDIFPKTKRHITRYCWRINFSRVGEARTETFQFRTENCLHNNCSDDECKTQ